MDPDNVATQAPTKPVLAEEGIVIHPGDPPLKPDVLEVQNVTNEAAPVLSLSQEFEPTPDMLKFRDTLIRTDAMRSGVREVCRMAGLHEDTYYKWSLRHGEVFRKWIGQQWGMRKQAGLIKLLEIGLARAEHDFEYWEKMVELFGRDDMIAPSPANNWEAVQRVTALYTLEKQKEKDG